MRRTWPMIMMVLALTAITVPALAGNKNANKVGDGCVKIEDGQIGVEGVSATVDGVTVTFTNWVTKDGEPGEYVGFDYTITGGTFVEFNVKQGKDYVYVTLTGVSGTWINPNGTGGSAVKAVSHVMFCGADDTPPVTSTTIVHQTTTTTTTLPPPPPG